MPRFESLWQDVRYGWRLLRRSAGFTLVAVLSLAAGIGLTTALFTLVDAWLLRPLPFPEADRLVLMLRNRVETPAAPEIFPLAHDYTHWARSSRSFDRLAGLFWRSYFVDGQGSSSGAEPELLDGMIATDGLFDTLGVRAIAGRTFTTADLHGPPVAVLGEDVWQGRFHRSPAIVGQTLRLSEKAYTIIGVVPAGLGVRMLNQPFDPKVYTLIQPGEPGYGPDDVGPLAAIGRLKAGVDLAAARAELNAMQPRIDALYPTASPQGFGVHAASLQEDNTRIVRESLYVLCAAAAFVLLVVCANVASLLLGRALARQKEMAVRAALGSTRARLMRQLLTESALLSILSVAIGIGVAFVAVRGFVAINPFDLLPQNPIAIDRRVLAFAAGVSAIATLIVGLAPARHVARVDVQQVLQDVGRGAGAAGVRTQRWRRLLVMVEIAACTVLLTGAALLLATLDRLQSEPLGLQPEGVTTIELTLPKDRHATAERLNGFYDAVLAQARALPGVESAAIGGGPLYTGTNTTFSIEGAPDAVADKALGTMLNRVTTDYFATVGIALRQGRLFGAADTAGSEPVALVNESVVRRRFGGQSPIGRRIRLSEASDTAAPWTTIVGVVGDTRSAFYNTLALRTEPRIYVLFAQRPDATGASAGYRASLYIRGRAPDARAARALVWAVDPRVPIGKVESYAAAIAAEWRQPRVRSVLIGTFAAFALLLAIVGLYAVTAQWVALRIHELGIRSALGARARDLVSLVLWQGLTLALIGAAVGLAAAFALARTLSSMLYGVTPADPRVLLIVLSIMIAAALLGCYLPARRAARIDPLAAMRHD